MVMMTVAGSEPPPAASHHYYYSYYLAVSHIYFRRSMIPNAGAIPPEMAEMRSMEELLLSDNPQLQGNPHEETQTETISAKGSPARKHKRVHRPQKSA